MKNWVNWLLAIGSVYLLCACQMTASTSTLVPDTLQPSKLAQTALSMESASTTRTQTEASPTATPSLSLTPTQTRVVQSVEALVWVSDPVIPVLNYHRFTPNLADQTSGMVKYIGDLKEDLERFYEAGYSLISIDDLMDGNIIVPAGRRPLILTIDDAYFANQFALGEDGLPSELSAIGTIYKFSQENPDFGSDVAMFANFGDKYYGNQFRENWWYLAEGWQEDLAKTIVWGIDHGVMPYNHLYRHPHLEWLADKDIQKQQLLNDEALRGYLALAGRPELSAVINNYIALPYGNWPVTEVGKELLMGYVDPEGRVVRAIFEAGYEYQPAYASAPFSDSFDPMHIPRMAAISKTIDLIIQEAENFPIAQQCSLQLPIEEKDAEVVIEAISESISTGDCPEGVFIVGNAIFIAKDNCVSLFFSAY